MTAATARLPKLSRFLQLPARHVAFSMAGLIVVVHALIVDRAGMIDHANYLAYFEYGVETTLGDLLPPLKTNVMLVVPWIVDEPLWRLVTVVLSRFVDAETAVRLIAVAAQLLLIASFASYRRPLTALTLWVLVPVGFAVIGTYQLRQGLAFAVWLFLLSRLRTWPALAALVAGTIHTTFLVVVPITFIAARSEIQHSYRLAAIGAIGLFAAVAGSYAFEYLGGRRAVEYTGAEHEFNVNYLIGLLIFSIYPLCAFVAAARGQLQETDIDSWVSLIALPYLGLLIYLSLAWFVFPIGGYRTNYFAWLGLIPLLGNAPSLRSFPTKRFRLLSQAALALMVLMISYSVVKALVDRRYACLAVPDCETVLAR